MHPFVHLSALLEGLSCILQALVVLFREREVQPELMQILLGYI